MANSRLNQFLGSLIYHTYRLWCGSLRYTEINRKSIEQYTHHGQPVVLCLWHDELFPLIYLKKDLSIICLVSQSGDGDLLAGVLQRMGLETARGSSGRGGVRALLEAVRRMHEAKVCGCVTVDGPRGPRHIVKDGAIFLAWRSGAPIVPIRLFMDQAHSFASWDRFQLPLPFSHVTMVCADPYHVEANIKEPEVLAAERQKLADILNRLHL